VGQGIDVGERLGDGVVRGCNDKGGMSPCDVAIEVGLFGMGEMGVTTNG
jgi:hypothetical protein